MTYLDGNLSRPSVEDTFVGREFPFTRRDFRQIASILLKDAGIALGEAKAPLVYSRLVKRMRRLGVENFKRYCELVETEEGDGERHHMIAALTTNVTRFFREPHHFEHLKKRVLPDLLEDARRGGRLRIWSAGCSTGEESYSIALTILSLMRDAPRFDIKILATDINKLVLAHGRQGVYSEAALAPVLRQQRADWFAPLRGDEGEKAWQVGDELRALVAFRELNLMADWPMKQAYDAIFCRNVLIYFEDSTRTQIWNRFVGLLAPRGCLYVGHSERIADSSSRFELEDFTTYRLKESAQP